jgi:hypothetical protein
MNTNILRNVFGLAASLGAMAAVASTPTASDTLSSPFRVEADGKPIDVEIGHAAPLAADFDGDGNFDLLVGQFGDGKLRIYRNQGDNKSPKFGAFAYFKSGGSDGKVPAG